MERANRFAWLLAVTFACHRAPPPQPASPGSLEAMSEALERADVDPASVTPEWVMVQIAELETIGANSVLPNVTRARAHTLAAKGYGVLIEHFTALFWNKAEPGRRVIAHLREALALDPGSEAAAVAYTFTLLGIRNSGFRSQAEDTMGVKTTPELMDVAQLLARHDGSLLAQSALRAVLEALAEEVTPPPDTAALATGLDDHIASLRARDPELASRVDAQLERYAR